MNRLRADFAPVALASLAPLRELFLALLIAATTAFPAHAANLTIRAFLDRNQIAVGQTAALTIEAQGAQDVGAPAITAPEGVSVRYAGPSTQVSFVNGQITSSVSHRYAVTPNRVGTFTLGPFKVDYDGKIYDAAAVRLQAVAAEKAAQGVPGRDEVHLDINLPRQRVYLQEQVPMQVVLTVGNTRVEDLQYPTLAAEGFTMDRLAEPKQTREVRDGKAVTVLRFDTTLTPLRSGTINVGPAQARMSLIVQGGRRGRDPFFDGFFGDYRREPIEISSNAVPLEVLALPEEDKPASFGGAVGRFTLEATAKPEELRVGDPVTVRVTIAGEGNLGTIAAPAIDVGNAFKAYPPQEVASSEVGQKVFEQVLIPLRVDVREVPPIRLTFFDTEKQQYTTLVRGPFPLTVRPAEEAQEARVVQAEGERAAAPRAAEALGRDIVYIKDAPGSLTPRGQRFFARPWLWTALLLPTFAYAGLWFWIRQRDRLRDDPRWARFARAGREASSALGATRSLLQRGDERGFDDALSRAVREYLAAKLDLPPGAVEADNVARRLAADGGAGEVAGKVDRILGLLERVRYAPSEAARSDREQALQLAEEIVAALEKQKYTKLGRVAAVLVIASSLLAASAVRAEDPVALFYDGNSHYGKGELDDAAKSYEAALAAGQESAALYYNLGNAYMKSGRPGLAILNYERARRLAPGDVDIATNLAFALEAQKIEVEEPLWRRMMLPLAERFGSGTIAAVCVALYAGLLLALAVRLVWPGLRTAAARGAIVFGALLLFAGANLGYRVALYDLAEDAVVTRAGETPVRFEPSADGTTHFSVPEGTLVHVLETRDGWLQVSRADGRRGWIEAGACERL